MKQTMIRLFSLLLLGMVATGAQADTYFKNYTIKLNATPSGCGKVYVKTNDQNTEKQNVGGTESVELNATISGGDNVYKCTLVAEQNEGFSFAGFTKELKQSYSDEDFISKISPYDVVLGNQTSENVDVIVKQGGDVTAGYNEAVKKGWDNAPTCQFYAIFEKKQFNVNVAYLEPIANQKQSETCGTWTRELTTDGKVRLTAIPKPGFIIKEWIDSNGTIITDNPIVVENEDVTYYPNFDLAPFEMPNSTLATFSHVFLVNYESTINQGMKAYKVTAIGANGLTLEQVHYVGSNTGVIVEAEPNATYTMTYYGVFFNLDDGGNLLKSSASGPVPANGKIYVLANKKQGLGFYKLADNEEVPQGKAYLEIDDANNARDFIGFDDGTTTSISSVAEVEQPTPIYNMAGQRVSSSFSGLVIQNGRKYIRK